MKALLGYVFSCVVVHLVVNQLIVNFGYDGLFYKPDLDKILKVVVVGEQSSQGY